MEEKKIGVVDHYFSHVGVGIIKIEQDGLKLGEIIHIKGHTTDFQQTVESMQIERKIIQEAKVGEKAGIKVNEPVREGDQVYKVIS